MAIPNPNPNIRDLEITDNYTWSSNKIDTMIKNKFDFTTEGVVGTWFDNETIYQKSIKLSNQTIPKNSALTIDINNIIPDIGILVDYHIIIDIGTDSLILPYSYGASTFTNYITEVAASTSTIVISRGNSNDLSGDIYITLKYTKKGSILL